MQVPTVPEAAHRDPRADRHGQERARASRMAERFNGEIINCDSTAVYRGFDIGTDKVPFAERRGIPHHLIDIADPDRRVHRGAVRARRGGGRSRDIHARGKLPILVGGTGFYYRALTRGLFPGPGKDAELRARLERDRRAAKGVETLHRMVTRVDPESARAHPAARSEAARPRARGVFPDRQAADRAFRRHRVAARRRRAGRRDRACACRRRGWPSASARRVDAQFDAGLLDEIRALLAARRAARRAAVRRPGLPAGDGAPARRPR